jgi:beta-lactam-binding protein with PASTA domain
MRHLVSSITLCVLALSLAACSGGEEATMPDLVGKRLDIALSDVERAGFDDEVEVVGGGVFGVVDESNWTVCSQEPASGRAISSPPRVTVDRSCKDGANADKDQDAVGNDTGVDEQAADAPHEPKRQPKKKKKKKNPSAQVADTFVMPALVGVNLQEAQDVLQARGSFLLTQTDGTGQERFQMLDYNWKVCAQDPPAGTVTSIATLVELVAVKLTESC